MTKLYLLAALGCSFALGGCGGGAGNSPDAMTNDAVTIISDMASALRTLQAAPAGTTNWGPNLLGNQYLEAVQTKQVFIARPGNQCLFDFQFETTHHQTYTVRGQDLCQHDVVHLRSGT